MDAPVTMNIESGSQAAKTPFTFRARANSFVFAIAGMRVLLREHNAWLHVAAAAAAAGAGWYLGISRIEWCLVIFAICSVFGAEAFNTAIETLADAAVPGQHPLVGKAKDLSAAGVLLASLGAGAIGVLVFGPHLLTLFGHSRPLTLTIRGFSAAGILVWTRAGHPLRLRHNPQ